MHGLSTIPPVGGTLDRREPSITKAPAGGLYVCLKILFLSFFVHHLLSAKFAPLFELDFSLDFLFIFG